MFVSAIAEEGVSTPAANAVEDGGFINEGEDECVGNNGEVKEESDDDERDEWGGNDNMDVSSTAPLLSTSLGRVDTLPPNDRV